MGLDDILIFVLMILLFGCGGCLGFIFFLVWYLWWEEEGMVVNICLLFYLWVLNLVGCKFL